MALRFFQVFLSESRGKKVEDVLEGQSILGTWRDATAEDHIVVNLLAEAEESEPILDRLEEAYSHLDCFQVVLLPVEAVLPRPKLDETMADVDSNAESEDENSPMTRISREELYHNILSSLIIDRVFIAMTIASSVVAAVGLLRDDVAVIIGAMVIAPLLGPIIAMALAATLGDVKLFARGLLTSALGLGICAAVGIAVGLWFKIDTTIPAIDSRTHFQLSDLALGLAAGAAGTFAFTRGISGAVIGVMVAVALVPPLAVFGMLLGAGELDMAIRSGLLVLANIVCINLAGIATFLGQGVTPRTWGEKTKANKSIGLALAFWVLMLAGLVAIIYFSVLE